MSEHHRESVLTIRVTMDEAGVGVTSSMSSPYAWMPGDLGRLIDVIAEHLADRVHGKASTRTGRTILRDQVSGLEITLPGGDP